MYWRDWRSMCGVKFLRLEDFLDNQRHGMCLSLEPQGMLFIEVRQTDRHYHRVIVICMVSHCNNVIQNSTVLQRPDAILKASVPS